MTRFVKDPSAEKTYGFDWANGGANDGSSSDNGWLQSDTISSSSWSVVGGESPLSLTLSGATNSTTETSVLVSGGTLNRTYEVTNQITTAGGETEERTLHIRVQNT